MNRTVVQVPMSVDLRDRAYNMAISEGFSNLQEAMRVIMQKFSTGALHIGVYSQPEPVQLSEKAIKRYDQMTKNFQNGKNVSSARNIKELMNQLKYGD